MNTRDEVVINRDSATWCAPNSVLGGEQISAPSRIRRLYNNNLPTARGARARSLAGCTLALLNRAGLSGKWTTRTHLAHYNKYNA